MRASSSAGREAPSGVGRRPGRKPKEEPVTIHRLAAIALIFIASAAAWFALGASILVRTGESDDRLQKEVSQLWGGAHVQVAPAAWIERERDASDTVEERDAGSGEVRTRRVTRAVTELIPAPLLSTRAEVALQLDQRRKGLLWYDTYGVHFAARYRFRNPDDEPRKLVAHFAFPSPSSIYDDFTFTLDGEVTGTATDFAEGARASTIVGPGQDAVLEVSYRSRGMGEWVYAFDKGDIAQVRDFALDMATDFDDIDFPAGTMSSTERRERQGGGWNLTWRFANLVTGQRIGMDLPNRLNPGPLAARITFFAPVSLLFFLTVMVMLGVTKGESLHPMNYFFLAGAFFAFHLLLAYLVDHVSIHVAFAIAGTVSVALVVSYLRLVTGMRRAVVQAGAAQVLFLLLFSYSFFLEGYAGLTVTIGAVLTLFALMQMTGRVSWDEVFAQGVPLRAPARQGDGR
jgi:hypothetical protein